MRCDQRAKDFTSFQRINGPEQSINRNLIGPKMSFIFVERKRKVNGKMEWGIL
jgi:hypothetical protein